MEHPIHRHIIGIHFYRSYKNIWHIIGLILNRFEYSHVNISVDGIVYEAQMNSAGHLAPLRLARRISLRHGWDRGAVWLELAGPTLIDIYRSNRIPLRKPVSKLGYIFGVLRGRRIPRVSSCVNNTCYILSRYGVDIPNNVTTVQQLKDYFVSRSATDAGTLVALS